MTLIHVLTGITQPRLHIWRDRTGNSTSRLAYDVESLEKDGNGLRIFTTSLDNQLHEQAHAMLHYEKDCDVWEKEDHIKTFPRRRNYRFPQDVWCAEGANRMLTENPFNRSLTRVTIHLITAKRYRNGKLFIWGHSDGYFHEPIPQAGEDEYGPYFTVNLQGNYRHLFLFKFMSADNEFEPDYANRVWSAHDGSEIWVHSRSAAISKKAPKMRTINIHVLDFRSDSATTNLHLWQDDADFSTTIENGTPEGQGWIKFTTPPLYTERSYGFMLHQPGFDWPWEHEEAKRNLILKDAGIWTLGGEGIEKKIGNSDVWTMEGDHHLFGNRPQATKKIIIEEVERAPGCGLDNNQLALHVWINRARSPLKTMLDHRSDGRWSFETYPDVVTSFKFRSGEVFENIDRHTFKFSASGTHEAHMFVVVGRADPLRQLPVLPLFDDPPFPIVRPAVWVSDGFVHFAVHCPSAASMEIIGDWTGWRQKPVPMQSCRDGSYWWAAVPVTDITHMPDRPTIHGVLYKYLISQEREVQDPAADWVQSSNLNEASRLVDHDLYQWQSNAWQRPTWDYLIVYQLHPSRFARRGDTSGLDGITREISDENGYLRKVNATALLLMPACECQGENGWGYDPAFFYTVESAYGGPDALKRLVDTCHLNGIAVLLDVVFNHAGTSDNILWDVARNSFFDGDTEWGAMINFDHPQVIHFFEQNLVHFMRNYRVDGFRFDFTQVIRHGGSWAPHIRQPGSGGGWEFMHRLRDAVRGIDERCILMAEHLPNEWDMTRWGGPMDTQWCDDFHDRIVDASRGEPVMGRLADAIKVTQTSCNQWYESTNYPESHDEVGNAADRICSVAFPQGFRRNKVAGAATLLSRGIPMWFMGCESAEWAQFAKGGNISLDLDRYENDPDITRVRQWRNRLCELRRGNNRLQGPSPVTINFAQDSMLAFSRGEGADIFVLLNFGSWSGWKPMSEFNLPDGNYRELLNSTWDDFRVRCENEDPHYSGWEATFNRGSWMNIPDYGAVVLEKR